MDGNLNQNWWEGKCQIGFEGFWNGWKLDSYTNAGGSGYSRFVWRSRCENGEDDKGV